MKPHSGSQLAVPDWGTWQPWGHGPIPTSSWGLWCSRNSRLFLVDCKHKFRSLGLISCLCRGSRSAGGPKDLCWSYSPESSCLEKNATEKEREKVERRVFFFVPVWTNIFPSSPPLLFKCNFPWVRKAWFWQHSFLHNKFIISADVICHNKQIKIY